MSEETNVLILSCGSRNKIVQYFKNELNNIGKVIATDCSELAPALYEADKHYIVPKINEDNYLNTIFSICEENNIKIALSLIDPEISLLAIHKQAFLDIGTVPIISEYEAVEICFDKYKMYEFLVENKFKTVRSYVNKEKFFDDINNKLIKYPVFVKPVKGSASINISKVDSREEIELLFSRYDNLMIQEYMDGIEYGIDVYVDLISEEIVQIFIKEKIKMRSGETDKSVAVKDEKLYKLIKQFVLTAGYKGIIDIDVFKIKGTYYISEVNPRFGGGYPHAHEAGMNVPKMIMNNVNSQENKSEIGEYKEGSYMMKFSEIKFIDYTLL